MKRTLILLPLCFFLLGASPQAPPSNMDVFDGCGMEGDAQPPQVKLLNRLKNRYTLPGENQINPRITLAAILAPGNDFNRWRATQAAEITGYVVNVKPGGPETVNCRAKDPTHTDTHIELALAPGDTPGIKHIIVDVTSRLRAILASKGKDWSTRNLGRTLLGRRVIVQGWMMRDRQHCNVAENTAPGNPNNWRATCWEIHPVTAFGPLRDPEQYL